MSVGVTSMRNKSALTPKSPPSRWDFPARIETIDAHAFL